MKKGGQKSRDTVPFIGFLRDGIIKGGLVILDNAATEGRRLSLGR